MHPIEWLRAVARSGDVPHDQLAGEAAAALAALADDPHGLLLACRRLIERNPTVGPLWWACARLVSSSDARAEARAVQRDLASDQVGLSLTLDLPEDSRVLVPEWSALADELASRRGDVHLLTVVPQGDPFDDDEADEADEAGDGRRQIVAPTEIGAAAVDSDLVLLEAWAAGPDRLLAAPGALAAAAVARHRSVAVWAAVGVGRRLPPPLFTGLRRRVFGEDERAVGAGADLVEASLIDDVIEPVQIGCPAPPELLRDSGSPAD